MLRGRSISESSSDLCARLESIFARKWIDLVPVSMTNDIAELCSVCENTRAEDQEKLQAYYLIDYLRGIDIVMEHHARDARNDAIKKYYDCAQLLLLAQCIYLFAPHASYQPRRGCIRCADDQHGALVCAQKNLDLVYNALFE